MDKALPSQVLAPLQQAATIVLAIILLVVCSLSLAGFLGSENDVCELLSHFRIAWCWLLIILSGLLLFTKLRTLAVVGLIVFSLNLCSALALYRPEYGAIPKSFNSRIKILLINLECGANHNYDAAISVIASKHADIVGISEVNDEWMRQLNNRLSEYPYRLAAPEHDGIALYSRLPILESETKLSAVHRQRFYAHFQIGQQTFVFEFAHPILPVIPKYRNDELNQLAQDAGSANLSFILAGDLNCTPWSCYFEKLMKDGRLHNTERGFGPQPTWNANLFVPVLPIDHCLTSAEFRTVTRSTGPYIGSDHLPVFVELALSPDAP